MGDRHLLQPAATCSAAVHDLVRMIGTETEGCKEQHEAIGSMARCGTVLRDIVALLDFTVTRLPCLKILRWLTADAYDAAGAELTRAALRSCDTFHIARSFIYLSPSARCGSRSDGSQSEVILIVFYALCLLANLTMLPEDGRQLQTCGLEMLNELVTRQGGTAICEVARVCIRNAQCTSATPMGSTPAALEQAPLLQEDALGMNSWVPPPIRPRLQPRYGLPSRRPGLHDVTSSLEILHSLPRFVHQPMDNAAQGAQI